MDISNGSATCDFTTTVAANRSLATTRGLVNPQIPNESDKSLFPESSPADAVVFTNGSSCTSGRSYIVTGATTNIDLGAITNVKLYITESITLTSELYLTANSSLYILPGQTVTMERQSLRNGQNDCLISIGKGSSLIIANNALQIASNFKLYNLGTFSAKSIQCAVNSVFFNAGTSNIEDRLSGENGGSTILNTGTMNAGEIYLQGNSHCINQGTIEVKEKTVINSTGASWENDGKWTTEDMNISAWNDYCFNKCQLIVKEELEMREAHLIVDGGGYVECNELYMNNSKVDLGAESLFKVINESEFGYNTKDRGFKGTGDKKALLVMKKTEAEYPYNADMIHYSGSLQILCSNHPDADLGWGKRWTLTNGAEWAEEGSNSVSIPATSCNAGYGGGTPTDPKDPFPIIMEDNQNYAYTFEDQWPLYGDYDMNDIVMMITKRKIATNNKNKVERFDLSIDLCAVGATKQLGAAIMFDEVPASTIKSSVILDNADLIRNFNLSQNIEKGQDLAVIPLFDNAHYALTGINTNVPVNTISDTPINTNQPKSINFTMEFSNPTLSADAFNVNKLNVFIFVGGNKEKRREIHVAGYQPTKLAETDIFGGNNDNSSLANKKYYISKENLAWGLMVPTSFKWPLEYANINTVYTDFATWVTSGGKDKDHWWNDFDEKKVFQTKKN